MRELQARQRQRSDTAARWTARNPLLLRGEIGYESDTGRFKFGDGQARWTGLPYRGGVATVNGTAPDGNGNVQLTASNGYTHSLTVRTQAEFDAMIASPDWFGAVSVLLCGTFTIPGTNGAGLTIPTTVLVLEGAPGAEICAEGDVSAVLQYPQLPTDKGRRVAGITVRCLGTGIGFVNLKNMVDCTATSCTTGFSTCEDLVSCRSEASSTCFSSCKNLTNCYAYISRGSICTGFSGCWRIANSCVLISRGAYSYGFDSCRYLSNCEASVNGTASSIAYNNCSYCSCCARGAMSANGQTWGGTIAKRCDATCDL